MSTLDNPEISLEGGIRYARELAATGHPQPPADKRPGASLAQVAIGVADAVRDSITGHVAGSGGGDPYLRTMLERLAARSDNARDFALGVLTEYVRQNENGWPAGEPREGTRHGHGEGDPDRHSCWLNAKAHVESVIYR